MRSAQPLTKGQVKLTQDRSGDAEDRKYTNTFEIDASGNFKGTGIAPGNYVAIVFQDDKSVDFNDNVTFAAGEDHAVNFDMTRKEYIDKMTPEEKKMLEEYKKKNAEAVAGQCEDRESECAADAGARGYEGRQLRRGDHGDAAGDHAEAG